MDTVWLAASSFRPPEEKNFNLRVSWNKPFPPWVAFIWIFCLSKRKEVKIQLWERVAWFSVVVMVSSEQTTVSLCFCFKIGEPEKNIIDHWLIVNVASRIAPTYCQNCCAATCWVEETCVELNILKFWQYSHLGIQLYYSVFMWILSF